MSDARLWLVEDAGRAVTATPDTGRSPALPASFDTSGPDGGSPGDVPATRLPRVYLYGRDVVLLAGVASQLRRSGQVQLAEEHRFDAGGVAVVTADDITDDVLGAIGAVRRSCTSRVIVIVNRLTRQGAAAAFEAGAWSFVRTCHARPERLAAAVAAVLAMDQPPGTVEMALGDQAEQLEREPAAPSRVPGLSDRDIEVLRLMADGMSTAAIATVLSYSESTIKNIIHAIVGRLGARNRAHAVAIAVRAGLI